MIQLEEQEEQEGYTFTDSFGRSTSFLRKGACLPFTCHFEDTATGCGIHQYEIILDFSDLLKIVVKRVSESEASYYSILPCEGINDGFAINHFPADKLIQLRPSAAVVMMPQNGESLALK